MSQMRHFRQNRARAFRFPRSAADAALCQSRHVAALRARQNSPLFDDVVGCEQQLRRYGQPERLGGLYIDDELELFGLHTGRSAGFAPFRTRPA